MALVKGNDLIPTNIDEINRLSGLDKVIALEQYHSSLKKQRKQEKKESKKLLNKIWHHKNPEYHKEYQKEYCKRYYQKHKDDKKKLNQNE